MSARPDTHWPAVGALAQWLRDWSRKRALLAEFESCGSEECDRMLHDLGLTRADLRKLAEAEPDATGLLGRMMGVLHLDPARVERTEPAVFRDLERVCALCDGRERCREELSAETAGAHWQEFCPNAMTLQALLDETRASRDMPDAQARVEPTADSRPAPMKENGSRPGSGA